MRHQRSTYSDYLLLPPAHQDTIAPEDLFSDRPCVNEGTDIFLKGLAIVLVKAADAQVLLSARVGKDAPPLRDVRDTEANDTIGPNARDVRSIERNRSRLDHRLRGYRLEK
jgi:hypothetical protein